MRRIIFLMLLAFLVPANAQVYKWVGPEGGVHFSDQPRPGAEEIVLPGMRLSGAGVYAVAPAPGKHPVPGIFVYREVRVLEPEYGATIRDNEGIVEVVVEVDPQLDTEAGDLIQVLLDRRPFDESSQSLERELYNVDRGRHLVGAQVINQKGRTLISSRPVTFYLHRERVDGLEPVPHDRFAELFIEEAGDELSAAERDRLKYATRDEFHELMDEFVPAVIERLDPDKREAFMERFIPRLAEELRPEEGARVIKQFMRKVARRLKPGDRPEFTRQIIEVVKEYLGPMDGDEARFVTTENQKEYWDRFVSLINDQLSPAERARLRYLANAEQRREFMERFVPSHLERLKPRQQRKFMEQFVPMFAAQLRPDRRQEFMETFVQTSMQSVHPEQQGEFMQRFIQRGVDPERRRRRFVETRGPEERERSQYGSPEERQQRLGGIPRPEERDGYRHGRPEERRKRFAEKTHSEERDGYRHGPPEERQKRLGEMMRPEERHGYHRGIPEERKTLRKRARRDQGVERHQQPDRPGGLSRGRARASSGDTASNAGLRATPSQPVTPSPAAQPPPSAGSRLFSPGSPSSGP